MKAEFIGKDRSMGFRKGETYFLKRSVVNNMQTPLVPSMPLLSQLSPPPTIQDTVRYHALHFVACQCLNLKQVPVFLYHLC